ncbi:MAG: glycosyltransferase [Rhodospirillaceae bacterium]
MTKHILHLVDDTTAGGVTRMLERLTALSPSETTHEIRTLRKGQWTTAVFKADILVSHLSVNWRSVPMFFALRALHPKLPLIHVEHSYSAGFVAANVVPYKRFTALLRSCYALFDKVVAVSSGQEEWILRHGLVSREALTTIRPVVDLAPFLGLEVSLKAKPERVGLIGRLHRQKGFDIAIKAFLAADPDFTLEIHGDGPDRAALEALAQGHERIRFHGFAKDPAAAMAQCDVVLMPSRWEPFGLVALEAQAAGRAVFCAAADGYTEHVAGGAVAVAGGSVEAWADVMTGLSDWGLPRRGIQGRQHALKAEDRFVGQWMSLFDALSNRGEVQATPPRVKADAAIGQAASPAGIALGLPVPSRSFKQI